MDTFLIDVPMPSMGATVNELTIISLKVGPGARVAKGQKIAELESDKSVFEFESPCDGTVKAVLAAAGEVKPSGAGLFRIETSDAALLHLQTDVALRVSAGSVAGEHLPRLSHTGPSSAEATAAARAIWTPRALKLAQEAGVDPAQAAGIKATGPGGRVSGDDFSAWLAARKTG